MRYALLALLLLLGMPTTAGAQISIGISIGAYPHFVTVPGYPVYYATDVESNYFFFDGLYWVYQGDNWYSSSWYDGPWDAIDPFYVPVYLLQVPVRYYHRPPAYFIGWQPDRAPRWGEHWGRGWDQRRSGWDRPHERLAPAPLPDYQRQYRGASYPKVDQQRALRDQNYRYRPQATSAQRAPAAAPRPTRDKPVQDRPVQSNSAPTRPNRDAKRSEAQQAVPRTGAQRATQPEVQQPAQRPQQQPRPQPQREQQPQRQPEAQRGTPQAQQRGQGDKGHPDENRRQDR